MFNRTLNTSSIHETTMVKNDILKSRVNPRLKQRLQTYAKIHGYRSTSALVCKVLENFMNEGSKQDENNIILRRYI